MVAALYKHIARKHNGRPAHKMGHQDSLAPQHVKAKLRARQKRVRSTIIDIKSMGTG